MSGNGMGLAASMVAGAAFLALRSHQDGEAAKRLDRIEQRMTDFEKRLAKIESLAAPGKARDALAEAKVKTAQAMMRSLKTALALYEVDNGRLPTTEQGLKALVEKPTTEPLPKRWNKYLDSDKSLTDPWGNAFRYRFPSEKDEFAYDLASSGPDGKAGTEDDIRME